jgi:hypothetical protein
MGGGEYFVQKANEQCEFATVGNIGQTHPTFSALGLAGEHWRVVDSTDQSIIAWQDAFSLWEPMPIYAYITDPFVTPEALFDAGRELRVTPTPVPNN